MVGHPPLPVCRTRLRFVLSLTITAVMAGCAPVGDGGRGQGPGGRQQGLALSPEQELQLGTEAYREILSKAEVVRGGPAVEHVRTVGQRIADVATGESQMSRLLRREINLHVDPRYYR